MSTPRGKEGDARDAGPPLNTVGTVYPHHFPSSQYMPQVPVTNTTSTSFPGVPNPWFPQGQSPSPLPWNAQWIPMPQQPPTSQGWCYPTPPQNASSQSPDTRNSDYMVDTLRRIYNNDDGSIEIERVKVQRRQPGDGRQITYTGQEPRGSPSKSLVPSGSAQLNERRPPPRKNKIKKQMLEMASKQQQAPQSQVPIAQPWYPYMPYMPMYPQYPYPYCVGYPTWPGGSPPNTEGWEGNLDSIESDRTSSRQESLPITNDSQRTESCNIESFRDSKSPESIHSVSPSPGSQITDSQVTDIAPSDSISISGYTREASSDRDFRSPTPSQSNQSHISEDFRSNDIGKTREWMLDMHRALLPTTESKSDCTDKTSFVTAPSDIPKAPTRRNKGKNKNKICRDNQEHGNTSLSFSESFDDTKTESMTGLSLAFKDLHKSAKEFESQVSIGMTNTDNITKNINDSNDKASETHRNNLETNFSNNLQNTEIPLAQEVKTKETQDISNSPEILPTHSKNESEIKQQELVSENNIIPAEKSSFTEKTSPSEDIVIPDHVVQVLGNIDHNQHKSLSKKQEDDHEGRGSRASTASFHSTRPSTDDQLMLIDTDSTDAHIPMADEAGEPMDLTTPAAGWVEDTDEDYGWIMQQPGDAPDLSASQSQLSREDERRNAWRAEVSLWRAKLVVSLCRGCGLDPQDWATFQLLVLHPLSLDLKLSLLHAPRLCSSNSSVGAGLVRSALLHLTRYGEILLQPEHNRQSGWRSIKVNAGQPWAPMKGSVEILRTLGYRPREDGVLRYPRRTSPETSILARLTLDMLVLAEELRLYITGTHQYSSNISQLFFPSTSSMPASPEPPQHFFQSSSSIAGSPEPPSTFQQSNRPTSAASYGFVSAQSTTSIDEKTENKSYSITDETSTLLPSVVNTQLFRAGSSSDEEKTIEERPPVKIQRKGLKRRPAPEPPKSTSPVLIDKKLIDASPVQTPSPALITMRSVSPDISSLPDLSSLSSSSSSRHSDVITSVASSSSGSVTPTASPEPELEEDHSKECNNENENKEDNKINKKDNPDEHIYEEITEIRAQVAALRAKEARRADLETPPPLPPKMRVQSTGEDDSGLSLTYPHVEWSTNSGSSSIRGGSTGARRKKRRAPLPPDFMPSDWANGTKASSESNLAISSSFGIITSSHSELSSRRYYDYNVKEEDNQKRLSSSDKKLNPFYEDIETAIEKVKDTGKSSAKQKDDLIHDTKEINNEKNMNPFDEDLAPSGFIGKNPFYEDIEIIKKENKEMFEQEIVCTKTTETKEEMKEMDPGREEECDSVMSEDSDVIKPKRRVPKSLPDTTSVQHDSIQPHENERNVSTQQEVVGFEEPQQIPVVIQSVIESKNVLLEQQLGSRVVVSNKQREDKTVIELHITEPDDMQMSIIKKDSQAKLKDMQIDMVEKDAQAIKEDMITDMIDEDAQPRTEGMQSLVVDAKDITEDKHGSVLGKDLQAITEDTQCSIEGRDVHVITEDKKRSLVEQDMETSVVEKDTQEIKEDLESCVVEKDVKVTSGTTLDLIVGNGIQEISKDTQHILIKKDIETVREDAESSTVGKVVKVILQNTRSSIVGKDAQSSEVEVDVSGITENIQDSIIVIEAQTKEDDIQNADFLENRDIPRPKEDLTHIEHVVEKDTEIIPNGLRDLTSLESESITLEHNKKKPKNILTTLLTDVMNREIYIPDTNDDENDKNDYNEFIDEFEDDIKESTATTAATPQSALLAFNITSDLQSVYVEDIATDEEQSMPTSGKELNTSETLTMTKEQDNVLRNDSSNSNEDSCILKENSLIIDLNKKNIQSTNGTDFKSAQQEVSKHIVTGNILDLKNDEEKYKIESTLVRDETNLAIDSDKSKCLSNVGKETEVVKSTTDIPYIIEPVEENADINLPMKNSKHPISLPLMPDVRHPLSIFDDIPYIDVNDVRNYQAKSSAIEEPSTPQYEIPELSRDIGAAPAQPVSQSKLRETALLLQGPPKLLYIDESDIPPDCTPPPPPGSSPPETPDTSPPETPHNSPPPSPGCISLPLSSETLTKPIIVSMTEKASFKKTDNTPDNDNKEHADEILANVPLETDLDEVTNPLSNKSMIDSLTDDRYEIPEPPTEFIVLNAGNNKDNNTNSTNRDETSNEIKSNETFEERYEIPDVVRNGPYEPTLGSDKVSVSRSWCVSSLSEPISSLVGIRKSLTDACPSRPPRGRRNLGPPPRPPKNDTQAPPLPPKGLVSLKLRRKSFTTSSSTPSTLRSRSVASTPTLGTKSSTTTSTPTSSRSKSKTINIKLKRKSKKTRSWPFMLCDCLYVDYYDDLK